MIIGKQIRFRAIEKDDLQYFVKWLNDPEVRQGLSMIMPLSLAEEENWFEELLKKPQYEKPLAIEIQPDPQVDEWINRLQRSLDADERLRLAKQVDSVLVDEAPYAFMWYPTSYTVVQPRLKGYVPHLMPNANRYTDVYFEE